MNRREFLMISAAIAASTHTILVNGRPSKKVAAAIVIGVDKPGNLPKLRGAVSGAKSVCSWLRENGFEVKLFIDEKGPVTTSAIYNAVTDLVKRGTLDQMVFYFAGHGCINLVSEVWMLSGAPENPNEAISLRECIDLARTSGIPNIVFISDACRSRPDSLQASRVRGNLVFPNRTHVGTRTVVDVFLATSIGDPSLEVPLDKSKLNFGGLYTTVFLSAYEHPDDDMVITLDDLRVVPNRRLESYLMREVTRKAETFSLQRQVPDSQIQSDDKTYISRVSGTTAASSKSVSSLPTLPDAASAELAQVGVRGVRDTSSFNEDALMRLSQDSGYSKTRDAILRASSKRIILEASHRISESWFYDTGFTVTGARVTLATSNPQIRTEIKTVGDYEDNTSLIMVDMRAARAGSIVLRFEDGSGTVIAALKGYIGNIIVDHVGVASVSYIPTPNKNWLWNEYDHERERIERLHATVATAARFGVFRVDVSKAAQLANTIRIVKMIDPTLGIYAAYAYTDADLQSEVKSVRKYLQQDLGADIFDLAMLSGNLADRSITGGDGTVPFCPVLSQGWGFLRVRNVRVPPDVNRAQDYLRPSLWTTFDREGTEIIIAALREGRLA